MENSLKGLILAAGVVITCIVVGLGFYLSREASNSGNDAISQIAGMTGEYSQVDKTMYDNTVVSGSEVVSAISKFSDEIGEGGFTITVYTGKKDEKSGGISFDSKGCDISSSKSKSSSNYINPDGRFAGEVVRDENGMISSLVFKQR